MKRATWAGTVAVEGVRSIDGRFIAPGALTWPARSPIPLMLGEQIVGVVTSFARVGPRIQASGTAHALAVGDGLAAFVSSAETIEGVDGGVRLLAGRITAVHLDRPAWNHCRVVEVREA